MQTLDVLLIEDRPGAATEDADALESAGHRIHRCDDHRDQLFACRVLDGRPCPVDEGVDLALVVRRGVASRPTPSEAGVSCAVRAGVPLVEDGFDVRDPYARFFSGRVTDDPVGACEAVVDLARQQLRDELRDLVAALSDGGPTQDVPAYEPGAFDLDLRWTGDHVRLTILGPDAPTGFRNRLAVRLLDAAKRHRPAAAQVDVAYRLT